jgi:hypothetical protein
MGSVALQRVTQDVMTEIDRVDVYITSKKVFLKGLKKGTSIPLTKDDEVHHLTATGCRLKGNQARTYI